jgi:hypothetical protein
MKVLIAVVFLVVGMALGLWLALGPQAPQGVVQSWEHVKAQGEQLWANAQLKIDEAQLPGAQGAPGPGLLDSIMSPFKAFGAGVARFWVDMSKSVRPPTP